jgi:hypothetical protein
LYSTKIDTIEELEEQFDKTENGTYEPNEKFKNNLSLTLIKREQGTQ